MLATNPVFDASRYDWVHLQDETAVGYRCDYRVAILDYDLKAGTCDFVMQFDDQGGHCPRHRHVATTTTLVLAGEHRVTDLMPDGSTSESVRKAGTHRLTIGSADAHPHLERGGDEGALVFFGNHTNTGLLYELVDEDLAVIAEVRIEDLVQMGQ